MPACPPGLSAGIKFLPAEGNLFIFGIICKIGFHASSVRRMGSCRRNEKPEEDTGLTI